MKKGRQIATMVEIYLLYTATAAVTAGMDVRIAVTVKDRPGGTSQATAEKSLK